MFQSATRVRNAAFSVAVVAGLALWPGWSGHGQAAGAGYSSLVARTGSILAPRHIDSARLPAGLAAAVQAALGHDGTLQPRSSDQVLPDATWSQQAEITATDAAAHDVFGFSAALSGDGDTALVGADLKTVGGNVYQGAVYVFVRSGTHWSQQAKLTASDGAKGDTFGISVALSTDGSTALIGTSHKKVGGNANQGVAYVFVHSGTNWSQQAELTASDGAKSNFLGFSAALSTNGNTALVGAYGKTVGSNASQGTAYVFVRSGTNWSQQAEISASDGAAKDEFGLGAGLSGDGNTALVGAGNKTVSGHKSEGGAYVFVRSGTSWSQQAAFTASNGAGGDQFGWTAALSADGSTALIGAWGKTVKGHFLQGAAYVFVHSGANWSQQAELTASDGAGNDSFGFAAALNATGSSALVGAEYKTVSGHRNQGAAYVFVRSGSTWSQQAKLISSDGHAGDQFGSGVALDTAGTTALSGAYNRTVGGRSQQGSAYVFTFS